MTIGKSSCPFKYKQEVMKDNPAYVEEEQRWHDSKTYKEREEMGFPSFYTSTPMMIFDYDFNACDLRDAKCVGESICPIIKKHACGK